MSTASPFTIACCSIALREKQAEVAVRTIAEAGFSAVEMWHPHISTMSEAELSTLRQNCDNLGLRVPVIAPYFSFTRGKTRAEESLRDAERVLRAAKILRATKVRTFTDCGTNGITSELATDDHWAAAISGLKKLCSLDPAMEFVLETHEYTLANTLPSIQRLLNEVAMPNLRLNFQANFDFLERGFLACLDELFPAVSHMHWEQITASDKSTYLEDEGQIDFAALIDFLRDKKYAGTASVEYCWSPVDEARIRSAWKFLQPLLSSSSPKREVELAR